MRRFVLERSSKAYFVHLACYLRELWYRLDSVSRVAGGTGAEAVSSALREVHEEQQDLLMYLSDVLDLEVPCFGEEVPSLGEALAERLLRHAIFPVILGSLLATSPCGADNALHAGAGGSQAAVGGVTSAGGGATASAKPRWLTPACALFVLHQVLDTFRSTVILEPLVKALLQHQLFADVQVSCLAPLPPPPGTYRGSVLAFSSSSWAPSESPSGASAEGSTEVSAQGGTASDVSHEPEQSIRDRLLAHLGSTDDLDACALLVTGILRLCLINCKAVPEAGGSLGVGISDDAAREHVADSIATSGGDAASPFGPLGGCSPLEVLMCVVQALECHASQGAGHRGLRLVVVQALASFALDLASEAAARGLAAELRNAAAAPARRAVQAAARQAQSHLHSLGDGFLDIFAEEWELHRGPATDVREACGSVRCLLPAAIAGSPGLPPEWALPAAHSERQHAAKAVRCLLVIQWLYTGLLYGKAAAELSRRKEHVPAPSTEEATNTEAAKDDPEDYPLYIAGDVVDGYKEKQYFELGRQDRIVCCVVTPGGPQRRYLVLHPNLLLLVTPDVVSPGWAAVRTVTPVRQVESQIDHGDERTLRLAIRLPKGNPCPGDASCYDPASCEPGLRLHPEEQRGGSFYMLTLSFEDPKRCFFADQHVRKRRQDVRAQVRRRLDAFIERLCS